MHILIIEREAKLDIASAMAYYDGDQEGLGQAFLEELRYFLAGVGENPKQYPVFRRGSRKGVMRRFPYVIVYRFDDTHVYVLAVMDGRRNPRAIARRSRRKS